MNCFALSGLVNVTSYPSHSPVIFQGISQQLKPGVIK